MDVLYVYIAKVEDASFTMTSSMYDDTTRFNIVTFPLAKMLSIEMVHPHLLMKVDDDVPLGHDLLLTWKKIPGRTAWLKCHLFTNDIVWVEEPSTQWIAFFRSLLWHMFDLQKTLCYHLSEYDTPVRDTMISDFLTRYPYNGVLLRETERMN